MKKILVINGANVNMIGKREPEIYGSTTLDDVNRMLAERAGELGLEIEFFHSNCIGETITRIQQCLGDIDGIIINPGADGHFNYSLLDAVNAVAIPIIEVHISNTHKREAFRHNSVIASTAACVGQIIGMGIEGYLFALEKFARM